MTDKNFSGDAQGKGPDAARAYLAELTAQQRYQRDIWY